MNKPQILFICAALLFTQKSLAVPNLRNQRAWSEQDKRDFLRQLDSNKKMSDTQAKYWQENGSEYSNQLRYLSLSWAYEKFLATDEEDKPFIDTESFSPRLVYGWHLFSWIRFYFGLQYSDINAGYVQERQISIAHYRVPLIIEMALIPLGTPHTRYVLLRLGGNIHYFESSHPELTKDSNLNFGTRRSYQIGLGYEWEIAETAWRVNTVVEGYQSMDKVSGITFKAISAVAGLGVLL